MAPSLKTMPPPSGGPGDRSAQQCRSPRFWTVSSRAAARVRLDGQHVRDLRPAGLEGLDFLAEARDSGVDPLALGPQPSLVDLLAGPNHLRMFPPEGDDRGAGDRGRDKAPALRLGKLACLHDTELVGYAVAGRAGVRR